MIPPENTTSCGKKNHRKNSSEPTCKTCYWYSLCPERSRLYPCRIFEDTRGGRTDGQAAPVGGAPSRQAQQLRRNVRRMLSEGWSPAAIRHEILTSPCTRKEQNKLLRELHMEVNAP